MRFKTFCSQCKQGFDTDFISAVMLCDTCRKKVFEDTLPSTTSVTMYDHFCPVCYKTTQQASPVPVKHYQCGECKKNFVVDKSRLEAINKGVSNV